MKLRNIGVLVTGGQLQGTFGTMTKWSRLPSDTGLSATADIRYKDNVVAGMPGSQLLYAWVFQIKPFEKFIDIL